MPGSLAAAAAPDHVGIVRRDTGIGVGLEQAARERHERVADRLALGERDVGTLRVRALADTGAHALGLGRSTSTGDRWSRHG